MASDDFSQDVVFTILLRTHWASLSNATAALPIFWIIEQ